MIPTAAPHHSSGATPGGRWSSLRRTGVVLVVVAVWVFSACGKGADEVATVAGTAADVSVRADDLPGAMKRCDYSGSIESYIEKVRTMSEETSASVAHTWKALQREGATEASFAVYADTLRACRYFVTGAPEGHTPGGVRLAATIVAKFADPVVAGFAYEVDVFDQSELSKGTGPNIRRANETGLGRNSVAIVNEDVNPKIGQAVWQAGAFHIFLRAQNLTKAEFDALAATLTSRTR